MTSAGDEPDSELENSAERVITLTDGVVAIAMTLLALDLKPELTAVRNSHALAHAFYEQRGAYLAFLITFALTAEYWTVHHRMMRPVRRITPALGWANMFFLFCITLLPLTTYVVGTYDGPLGNTIFAGNLFLASVAISLLYQAIVRGHLSERPVTPTEFARGNWRSAMTIAIPVLVGGLTWVIGSHASWLWLLYFAADVPGTLATRRRTT